MLAIEALIRLLPRYWHKVKGLEELVKEGRLYLPEILLSNALRSIKDGERGWSTNKFGNMINMIYYCPGGNNKTFHSPKLQNKHGPIQCSINEGYVTGFDFKFIEEYLLKSSDEPTTGASAHSTRLHSLQPSQCPSCSRSRHP